MIRIEESLQGQNSPTVRIIHVHIPWHKSGYIFNLGSGYPWVVIQDLAERLGIKEGYPSLPSAIEAIENAVDPQGAIVKQQNIRIAIDDANRHERESIKKIVFEELGKPPTEFQKRVTAEQERQKELHGYPQTHTPSIWVSILTEEVGEVAKEALAIYFQNLDSMESLYKELSHVAAVASTWAEQIENSCKGRDQYGDLPK